MEELMCWVKARRCWRKMYHGVMYEISCKKLGCPPQQALSRRQANAWWKVKQHDLDNIVPDALAIHQRLELELMEIYVKMGLNDYRIEALKRALNHPFEDIFVGQVEEAHKIGQNRIRMPLPATLGDSRQDYFTLKAKVVKSAKGLASIKRHVNALWDWLNGRKIDGQAWSDWFAECGVRYPDDASRRNCWADTRAFISWLDESEVIVAPRNLKSKHFSISNGDKTIITWEPVEIQQVFAELKCESRLHFLLMLNCGFQGMDIANLLNTEIDLVARTITRKRSKTKDEENTPVVTYRLWDDTFDLLMLYKKPLGQYALLHPDGLQWIVSETIDGACVHRDRVSRALTKVAKTCGVQKQIRKLRNTSASTLGSHTQFKFYTQYFLGHSPKSMAEKYYLTPNNAEFFLALAWLREQYTF